MQVHKVMEVIITLNPVEVLEFKKLMEIVHKVVHDGWDNMEDGELSEEFYSVSRYLVDDLLDAVK